MRRVLANREAARRTIRRRKEELKRKAADLALENEHLKKNKELAAAEYNYLMNKNNNLRMQIAKIVNAEVEETDDYSKSTPTSTTSPTFLHNQSPKVPLIPSTVFPSFDGVILQSGWQSFSGITPQMPTSLGGFIPSDRLESSVKTNNPGTPLYKVSFPWQLQFHAQNERASEGSTQLSGFRSKGLVQVTSTSSPFVLPVFAGQNESTTQNTPDVKVAVGRVAGATTEMYQECVTCSNNTSADAITAAEARRKMKMLMK